MWADNERRNNQSATIEQKVFKVTSEQQQWLLAVFCVTRFLAANDLPIRGDNDGDLDGDRSGRGLFQCTLSQLLFQLEPKWKQIYKHLTKMHYTRRKI